MNTIRLLDVWTWGSLTVRACPVCHCNPDAPCTIVLADGVSTGHCVPAGAYDMPCCSSHLSHVAVDAVDASVRR